MPELKYNKKKKRNALKTFLKYKEIKKTITFVLGESPVRPISASVPKEEGEKKRFVRNVSLNIKKKLIEKNLP